MSARFPVKTAGFFTDATLCIGCKACEVACKEWNELTADGFDWSGLSYDHTLALGASTWRHVKFVEHEPVPGCGGNDPERSTWGFASDVCKPCEHAGCLEVCPTGAIVRTETGGVFVQPDVCNGCSYCVVGCPFGVIERSLDDGRAFKCTFCYDRQKAGLEPACAKACPTESIRFGELSELRAQARERVAELLASGMEDATLWDPLDTSVGGTHAIFLVRGDPRAYNLPRDPVVPTVYQREGWRSAGLAALGMALVSFVSFFAGRSR